MTCRGWILRLAALVMLGIALAVPAYDGARAQAGPGPGGGPPGGGAAPGGPGPGGPRGGREPGDDRGPGAPRPRNPFPSPERESGDFEPTDQERALNAVRDDLALPLEQILIAARHVTSGKLVDASLETLDGELHYLLRMLEPSGDVREYFFNARTAQLVRVK